MEATECGTHDETEECTISEWNSLAIVETWVRKGCKSSLSNDANWYGSLFWGFSRTQYINVPEAAKHGRTMQTASICFVCHCVESCFKQLHCGPNDWGIPPKQEAKTSKRKRKYNDQHPQPETRSHQNPSLRTQEEMRIGSSWNHHVVHFSS